MLLIGQEREKGQIGKIPDNPRDKLGRSRENREGPKKDKKGRTGPDREAPLFETPPSTSLIIKKTASCSKFSLIRDSEFSGPVRDTPQDRAIPFGNSISEGVPHLFSVVLHCGIAHCEASLETPLLSVGGGVSHLKFAC